MNHIYVRFLKKYALKTELYLKYILIIGIIAVTSFVSIIQPRYEGKLVDDLSEVVQGNQQNIIQSIIIFLLLLLMRYMLIYVLDYIKNAVSEDIAAEVRKDVHKKLTMLDSSYFSSHELSDVLLKMDKDVESFRKCSIASIITLVSNIVLLICVLPYMLNIHFGISLINILLICLIPFCSQAMGKLIKKTTREVLSGYKEITGIANHTYSNWIAVRLFQCGTYMMEQYEKKNRKYKSQVKKQNLLYDINSMVSVFIQMVGIIVIWVWGAYEIFQGRMTVGMILALMGYQGIIMSPILSITSFTNDYHTSYEALKDLVTYLDYAEVRKSAIQLTDKPRKIQLENLGFCYGENDKYIFRNVNMTFEYGKTYFIKGDSGQGKSTLFNLLMGFLTPTEGKILIDGIELQSIDITSYWKQMGYVMQTSNFFTDSIRKNLDLSGNLSDEEIIESCNLLGLKSLIDGLEDGIDTVIKEDASNFSGGQLRRFDIARNILKDTTVLILDEVTANVDDACKKMIFQQLEEKKLSSIIIYSSHNPIEAMLADEIYYIADGKIERSSNDENRGS